MHTLVTYTSFLWCLPIIAMNTQIKETQDTTIVRSACASIRSKIPAILEKNEHLNRKKGIACASYEAAEDLERVCSAVENIFSQQASFDSFTEMHEKLKFLIPRPTYCTYTLYKEYRNVLEQVAKKPHIFQ